MATKPSAFTEEEMAVDEGLGYPKAYSQLCRSSNLLTPYIDGPPHTFLPYQLQPQEALRAKDLNQMFPVVDPGAKPSMNPTGYLNLLWRQLDHLGNAGFDPALFRVDQYGNVLYLHADSSSPLAWDVDHWFPCSRGGKTVPSNLRVLQWQVCRKKQSKLDFLVPWWDLQLGISVNQFLSIFASRNTDFRNRAFSFLFLNGGCEELNESQVVESHTFPQHFNNRKRQFGLAAAAIVSSHPDPSVLRSLDLNKSLKQNYALKGVSKENENPNTNDSTCNPNTNDSTCNSHLSIVMARDSLRQRDESRKVQAELNQLEEELNGLKESNDAGRLEIQELEEVLIKRRRRVEKCRRLAESQSSYKALLEKMIRDAMHQSVVYKEQIRLNQSASNALMARLEAQRSICDSSENELRRKFRQRDEIEKQIRPSWEQTRKRSRIEDTFLVERQQQKSVQRSQKPLKKELREFLEEAQKASAELSLFEKEEEEEETNGEEIAKNLGKGKGIMCRTMTVSGNEITQGNCSRTPAPQKYTFTQGWHEEDYRTALVPTEEQQTNKGLHNSKSSLPRSPQDEDDQGSIDSQLMALAIREGTCSKNDEQLKTHHQYLLHSLNEGDEEVHKNQAGKGNVDKWLQILLENTGEPLSSDSPPRNIVRQENHTEEIVRKPNLVNPQKEIKYLTMKPSKEKGERDQQLERKERVCNENRRDEGSDITGVRIGSRKSFEAKQRVERKWGEGVNSSTGRTESSRGFRSLPSSPSVILGMRKGVECIGKKPKVIGDEDDDNDVREDSVPTSNRFIKTCTRALKKAVNY